jgi:hypothetical protein
MAPTLVAARTALPPEGANFPWGGPAGNWAPTLVAARTALPPEGANFPWGGPAGNWGPPRLSLRRRRGESMTHILHCPQGFNFP